MDFQELNDSSASVDSQALLALEFNNQASLRNDDGKKQRIVDDLMCNKEYLYTTSAAPKKKFQDEIENNW